MKTASTASRRFLLLLFIGLVSFGGLFGQTITIDPTLAGSTHHVGENLSISWTSTGLAGQFLELNYQINGGAWKSIASNVSTSPVSWTIANTGLSTASMTVRVSIDTPWVSASEIATFTVTDGYPDLTITQPISSFHWESGSSNGIDWTSLGVNTVNLEYSLGGQWIPIATAIPATPGVYFWHLPSGILAPTAATIRITCVDPPATGLVRTVTFTIDPAVPKSIAIDPSLSGSTHTIGENLQISWSSTGLDGQLFLVEHKINGGQWTTIGMFPGPPVPWTLPNPGLNSIAAAVRVSCNSLATDAASFTIAGGYPDIAILAPGSNAQLVSGHGGSLYWYSVGINTVNLDYSIDGGTNWQPIAADAPADNQTDISGSYDWQIPVGVATATPAILRISSADLPAISLEKTVNVVFEPSDWTLTLDSPNGGEQFQPGDNCNIQWHSTGIPPITLVQLQYSIDNGKTWTWIANAGGASSPFAWQVPNVTTIFAKIRVTATADDSLFFGLRDDSNNPFSIAGPIPTLHLATPDGAQIWKVGSTHAITWTSANIANVKIELSVDGGGNFITLASSYPASTGTFDWTITDPNVSLPVNNAIIRMTDLLTGTTDQHTLQIKSPWVTGSLGSGTGVLNDVCVVDAAIGWAVGTQNQIFEKTATGGAWNPVAPGLESSLFEWTGVSFISTTRGWLVGEDGSGNCKIHNTADGGTTWDDPINCPVVSLPDFHSKRITFSDVTHGLLVGQQVSTGNGVVYSTADGGKTWSGATVVSPGKGLNAATLDMLGNGFAVGDGGGIYYAPLGGSWNPLPSGTTANLNDITRVPDAVNAMWVVGDAPDAGHWTILYSPDGSTWTADAGPAIVPPASAYNLYGISFVSATHGWAVGASGTVLEYNALAAASPRAAYRSPMGVTNSSWNSVPSGTDKDLKTLAVADAGSMWFMGDGGTAGTFNLYGPDSLLTVSSILPYRSQWNMISIPFRVSDPRRLTIFPQAISPAWNFNNNEQYEVAEMLQPGKGYWLKFASLQNITVSGLPNELDTIPVQAGWNMIGSLDKPVPTSAITGIPNGMIAGQIYGYQDGYISADTVQPGKGYWIKTNQAGSLVLSTSLIPGAQTLRIVPARELPPPPPGEEVQNVTKNLPREFSLGQNYPNPFNPTTDIGFRMSDVGYVTLNVYNVLGQEVATLMSEVKQPGEYQVRWDASAEPSGVYYCRLTATGLKTGDRIFTGEKKMMLLK